MWGGLLWNRLSRNRPIDSACCAFDAVIDAIDERLRRRARLYASSSRSDYRDLRKPTDHKFVANTQIRTTREAALSGSLDKA
jgi:hypothetical protein